MKRLIILRPEPAASASVDAARDMGLDALAIPLFRVEPLAWHAPEPSGFDALLLTSANALRHGGAQLQSLRGLKAYCVGDATAQAARDAGFDIAATGDAGIERLLGSIEPDLRLLHLAGRHRTEIQGAKQDVTTVEVYTSEENPPPEGFADVKGAVVALHSRRAAARVGSLVDGESVQRSSVAIAAISRPVAEEAGTGWGAVEVAEKPDDASLLALASTMCNKTARS